MGKTSITYFHLNVPIQVRDSIDSAMRMRRQRDVNADGKRIFIVGSIVIFLVAVGAMILVIMGPEDNFTLCENIHRATLEKQDVTKDYDITEVNECQRDIDCSFDSKACDIPCPLGFEKDYTGCDINCQCASSSMGYFQGDIFFNDLDVNSLLVRYGYASEQETAAIFTDSDRATIQPWPKKLNKVYVPYTINIPDLNIINAIQMTLSMIKRQTCIEFATRSEEKDYIVFDNGVGCWSRVGKGGGKQRIVLGRGCRYPGFIMHLVMHAIGFEHQHVRPDRDGYIRIDWENVRKDKTMNFAKIRKRSQTMGSPYDTESVTHIGSRAWSVNQQKYTFAKVNGEPVFGQRASLAPGDVMEANYLYDCDSKKRDIVPEGIGGHGENEEASMWTDWTQWSQCTGTCGTSESVRHRSCNITDLKCPYGGEWQRKACVRVIPCPVAEGQWLAWDSWEKCSKTCSLGYQWRKRKCPVGVTCEGHSFMGRYCVHPPCPGQMSERQG